MAACAVNRAFIVSARRPQEARSLFQLALDTVLAHELRERAGMVYSNLSDLEFQRDRYAESLGLLERSVELARKVGHRTSEWFSLAEMTHALTMLGRWDEALARLAEVQDEHLGDPNTSSVLPGVLEIHLNRGHLVEARQLLAR